MACVGGTNHEMVALTPDQHDDWMAEDIEQWAEARGVDADHVEVGMCSACDFVAFRINDD